MRNRPQNGHVIPHSANRTGLRPVARALGFVAACLVAVVLVGCGEPDAPSTDVPAGAVGTPGTSTVAPSPELSSADIYALVAPSVPFVVTPSGSGSGLLVDGGYVVTNYHVMWPHYTARVVFPDGSEIAHVPLVAWDPMADLAVLGPVTVPAPPLTVQSGQYVATGSPVYFLGYPAETDSFPQASITRGVVSRYRVWEKPGITYIQTDATIATGQSGGALVDSRGRLIGIAAFPFGENEFALAASTADVAPIWNALIQGIDPSELGNRYLPLSGGGFGFGVSLDNYWDTRIFVMDASVGTTVEIELNGDGDGLFHVSDADGFLLEVDDNYSGLEAGAVDVRMDGVHFLQVELASGDSSTFELNSNVRLRRLDDPDDGRIITVGETVAGSLDYFYDVDWFSIRLNEGDAIRVSTDSYNVDTLIFVDYPQSDRVGLVSDDNSGGGLFSIDSSLVYRAPHTGRFIIAVKSATPVEYGGYYLSVEPAVIPPETTTVETGGNTADAFGAMRVFVHPDGDFTISIPVEWIDVGSNILAGELLTASDPEGTSLVTIIERDVGTELDGTLSLTWFADLYESILMADGAETVSRSTVETAQELSAVRFEVITADGLLIVFLVSRGDFIFQFNYGFPMGTASEDAGLADYLFSTYRAA